MNKNTKNNTMWQDSRTWCDENRQRPEENAHEKRQSKRLNVLNMNIQSEIPLASRVTIINISASGVLVKADRRLNIGNTYLLKIGYKDNLLFVRAVVKWSFLAESSEDANGNNIPLYLAGMHFQEVTSGSGEGVIQTILSDLEADASQFIGHAEECAWHTGSTNDKDAKRCGSKEKVTSPRQAVHEETLKGSGTDQMRIIIEKIEREYMRYTENNLSYYEFLNVRNDADGEEIKKAYYRKVKEFHPDRHSSLPAPKIEKLNVLFSHLNEAYTTLMHAEKRNHYDRTLLRKQPAKISNEELANHYFGQGKIEFWNGNYTEAETLFQHVIYLRPSSAKYFSYYAKTLLKLGKLRDAEKAIRNALKLEPSNSDYLAEAGYIHHALGLSNRAR